MNDHELDSLIRQSHPRMELPASFNREVWERVSVASPASALGGWRDIAEALFLWISRPAPAVAVIAVMLVFGAGLGGLTVRESSASAQRNAYFASINPLHPAHIAAQP